MTHNIQLSLMRCLGRFHVILYLTACKSILKMRYRTAVVICYHRLLG